MDPRIAEILQKLIADGATQITPGDAPPPYSLSGPSTTNPANNIAIDDEDEFSENDDDDPSPDVNFTINATHNIRGNNNIVPTAATTYSIASKLSDALVGSIERMHNPLDSLGSRSSARRMKVSLTINCGITIIGDRNVVGNIPHIGLKPKSPVGAVIAGPVDGQRARAMASVDGGAVQIGAKRKAERDGDDMPEAKRVVARD